MFESAAQLGLVRTASKARYQMETHFGTLDYAGRRVLDVGGGAGVLSFYAASRGAEAVDCVEPEADGSRQGVGVAFERLRSHLGVSSVTHVPCRIQECNLAPSTYDIVLMSDSINHLDEEATVALRSDPAARRRVLEVFQRIATAMRPGAVLMFCDCSSENAFTALGLRNPFAANIEWHKHQTPDVWIDLWGSVGLSEPKITWSSFSMFGRLGATLLANRLGAYLTTSHYYVRLKKGL